MDSKNMSSQVADSAHPGSLSIQSPRLIRLPEVMKRVGLSRSAIYKRMAESRFPRSRSLGPKCVVWLDSEIDEWIESIAKMRPSEKD